MIAALLLATLAPMTLRSPDFRNGAALPHAEMARGCGGANRSPALVWRHAPAGTKSFALILHDPDAPRPGGFDHWVLYDLPASTRALQANVTLPARDVGLASTGVASYHGPCPPPGPAHHYHFTLYALDEASVAATAPLTAAALRAKLRGHVLATATLLGIAARP